MVYVIICLTLTVANLFWAAVKDKDYSRAFEHSYFQAVAVLATWLTTK